MAGGMSRVCLTGKRRWRRRGGAHRAAKQLTEKNRRAPVRTERSGLEAHAYLCPDCGGFHVATRDPRPGA
jgi:hypothetical protein